VGTEQFFISEIKKTFLKNILSENKAKDFNYDEVSASEILAEDLLALWETLPLMLDRRLIFCYQAEKFTEKDWEKFIPVFKLENTATVLVLFFEKKDGRKKYFKFLKNHAVQLSADPVRDWELEPWLELLCQKENLKFIEDSKSLFCQLMGVNLMEIQLELKKLKQYMGERKQVSSKDVLACSSRLKMDSIFDLTEALGKKDIVQALSSLACLLEQNQNEIGALAMLARHIRVLSIIQEERQKNLSKNQLAQKAGISPYFLKSYLNQSSLWSKQQIRDTMEALFETDKALKSSPLSSHIYLENFILKACS